LPFSIAESNNDLANWVSQGIGLITVMTNQTATLTLLCDQFRRLASGHLLDASCLHRGNRVRGPVDRLRTTDVGDAFLAQTAELVSGLQDSAVMPANDADHPCPSATVAGAVSLPS
jgi:hypothetical protein